jgi:Uncharacterized protein conserved in bacteria
MPSYAKAFEVWNRKLHYYLGLYFLFFLWLFSATGLMLNHQQWFGDLYRRAETAYDTPIETPDGDTLAARTRDLMRQLGLQGEIDWPATQPVWHIDFNVSRPNGAAQVRVDLTAKQAYVREFRNRPLHAFQIFHTFSGSRFNQPASERDWMVTSVWVFAMDALALGLVVMVLGSYYMWWQLKKKRTLGAFALAAGLVTCGAFVAGIL